MRSDMRSRSLRRCRRSALLHERRYRRFAKLPAIEALGPRRLLATEVVLDSEDTTQVDVSGEWIASAGVFGFHGVNYLHDGGPGQGQKQITFHPNLPQDGRYDVMLRWTAAANRASNASVTIDHRDGTSQKTVNQQIHNGAWISVGEFAFTAGSSSSVSLSNQGADGYVIADAVRFVKETS